MSSFIGDDLVPLLTEQSNLYHSQYAKNGKCRLKH